MKKLSKILMLSLLAVFLVAGSAQAVPFGDGGAALQDVLDNITTAPTAGVSSVDVTTDALADSVDSYWSLSVNEGAMITMIIELAGFAPNNVFGVYSGAQYVALFTGSNVAGDQTLLSIASDGSVFVNYADTGSDFAGDFGYYVDSSYYDDGGVWHSDTTLNTDDLDHMAAYQGTNTDTVQFVSWGPSLWTDSSYILAFEDLDAFVADCDYTDIVVMVDVKPIPEPATMLLLGTGLIGLAGFSRRRFKK